VTVRVFGLGYDANGSALLWPWALIVCDEVDDLPTAGLQEGMQAYVFEDENYYVVNSDEEWAIDQDPDLHYASAPAFEALERRVAELEEGAQAEADSRSPRERGERGNRISTSDSRECGRRGNR
jgi:hypothetical protein